MQLNVGARSISNSRGGAKTDSEDRDTAEHLRGLGDLPAAEMSIHPDADPPVTNRFSSSCALPARIANTIMLVAFTHRATTFHLMTSDYLACRRHRQTRVTNTPMFYPLECVHDPRARQLTHRNHVCRPITSTNHVLHLFFHSLVPAASRL